MNFPFISDKKGEAAHPMSDEQKKQYMRDLDRISFPPPDPLEEVNAKLDNVMEKLENELSEIQTAYMEGVNNA